MLRTVVSVILRAAVTAFAFWWIFREVNLEGLRAVFRSANPLWLAGAVLLFGVAQLLCVARWRLLVPKNPALTFPFLADSFLVGLFFNTFLPTTVGGDVMRSYDLIKATGNWRDSLASVLVDRIAGMAALVGLALIPWLAFAPAREDPVLRAGFFGLCVVMIGVIGLFGSRRVLRAFLKPFGKIGLGTLAAHTKQFQESIVQYRRRPKTLAWALALSFALQVLGIGMYWATSLALALKIPPTLLFLIVPIISTVAMIPLSLNGWGIREGAMILFLDRIGVAAEGALSLSLVCALIPVGFGAVGGLLFLTRRLRKGLR